jgi:GWxTD domain-containing protein
LIKTSELIILDIMSAKFLLGVMLVALAPSGSVFPQSGDHRERIPFATWILNSSKDSVTLCAAYAIPFNKIIFIRTGDTSSRFTASLSVSVDALDSATGINYHQSHRRNVAVRSFAESQSNLKRITDCVTFTLPRSVYNIDAEVRDEVQKINYLNTAITRNFTPLDSSGILSLVFLDSVSEGRYYPVISDSVVPFPSSIRFLFLTQAADTLPMTISLATTDGKEITGAPSPSCFQGRIKPLTGEDEFCLSGLADSTRITWLVELQIDSLNEGSYQLIFSRGRNVFTRPFRYLWLNKPLTLRNITLALSLLKYILPDSTYSEINSGSDTEIREKFDAFWKSQDPTPLTAFNELEAEYYTRADYAYEQFGSLETRNGAATDRGKAYILFGKPESVRREFRNDGTYEIWSYPNLKRSLVFKEQNFGEFKLYRTENL